MRPFAVIAWMIAWLSIAAGALSFSARAVADTVDLLLVLAVDVSLSMDLDEQRLQRDGYVAAFRDPTVLKAIASGTQGRIAVTYVEWAGPHIQATILPWTLIDGPDSAEQFAAALEAKQISRARMTSISGALVYADRTIAEAPFKGTRRVIDVSGDGPNNAGFHVVPTRDEIVAKGIVINGLPLMLKASLSWSAFDIPNLDAYYAECVIGGPGSFSIPVRDKQEIGTAIRKKLVLEISDLGGTLNPQAPLLQRTQLAPKSEPVDCLIGEKLWRQYFHDLQAR